MNECCKDSENLYRKDNDTDERDDVVIHRCKVCGCRHFEATVDPGTFDFKGGGI